MEVNSSSSEPELSFTQTAQTALSLCISNISLYAFLILDSLLHENTPVYSKILLMTVS